MGRRGGGYLPPPSTPAYWTHQRRLAADRVAPRRACPCLWALCARATTSAWLWRAWWGSPNLRWSLDGRPDSAACAAAKGVGWDPQRRRCPVAHDAIGWPCLVDEPSGKNLVEFYEPSRPRGACHAALGADRLPPPKATGPAEATTAWQGFPSTRTLTGGPPPSTAHRKNGVGRGPTEIFILSWKCNARVQAHGDAPKPRGPQTDA